MCFIVTCESSTCRVTVTFSSRMHCVKLLGRLVWTFKNNVFFLFTVQLWMLERLVAQVNNTITVTGWWIHKHKGKYHTVHAVCCSAWPIYFKLHVLYIYSQRLWKSHNCIYVCILFLPFKAATGSHLFLYNLKINLLTLLTAAIYPK